MTDENNKLNNPSEQSNPAIPEEISEVLEGVPEEKRRMIEALFVSQTSFISRFSPEMETSKKITSEHITKLLDTDAKAMEYSYKDKTQARWFYILISFLICVVLIALVVLLKDNPTTMEKIITIVISTLVGGAGGYGLGVKNRKDSN